MKQLLAISLMFFFVSGLFAQTECTVKIGYSTNKSSPPSYTFKVDPLIDGAKYMWSFGDNTISDSPSPTHGYKTTNTYLVTVKVTGKDGKICYGELKEKFEGGAVVVPATTFSGRGKVKDLSSTAGCKMVISMENGTVLVPVEIVPAFTFKDGQYVELAYTLLKETPSACSAGISAKILKIAEIVVPVACNVPITYSKNNTTPVSYTFKTTPQSDGSVYSWSFGDGGFANSATASYTFKKTGVWVVNLKVVDKSGKVCTSEMKAEFVGQTNAVLSGKGKVKKLTLAGCDLAIVLETNTTLIPYKIATDFQLKEGQYVEFTYEKFTEKVSGCKEGTDVKIITIKEVPQTTTCKAYFTATNKLWSDPSMFKKIAFSNSSVGDIKEYKWNFGDNTSSTEKNPIHEYAAVGEYKVCLSITTTTGCTSEYCAAVKVETIPVVPVCKFDIVIKPKTEASNTFAFATSSAVEIKTWKWSFGDSKTSDLKNPEHTYEKTGVYEITCTIVTATGCTESRTLKQTVATNTTCKGAINLLLFDPTDNKCNGKAIVKLVDETGTEIKNVKYTWSDGRTTSTVEGLCPDKTYGVQAIVDNVCQKNTSFTLLSKPVWVASSVNGQNSFAVVDPKVGVNYEWDFGNGVVVKGAEVNYNFEKDGVYNVNVKASGDGGFAEYAQQVVVLKSVTGTSVIHKSDLEIFPNPTRDLLKINFGNPVDGSVYVEITNVAGKQVLAQKLDTDGCSQASVNVQELKSGIYFIRVSSQQHVIASQKFLKTE